MLAAQRLRGGTVRSHLFSHERVVYSGEIFFQVMLAHRNSAEAAAGGTMEQGIKVLFDIAASTLRCGLTAED